ncbi:hypothetical protein LZ318_26180 [Saccharopolyspora indica]|uniref:mechanosensitive ion channel family protein n=1 Tax=Saccharopolyspora indica TaxID=1229659 RepID=UPI0022EA9C0D|nr:hypothetical protein [Saccharopolyspora indica]MDA3648935.1 hypothetical protein [Saccharopolyspora indica]
MDTLQTGLAQAWANIATFVPKLVMFLVVLLIGWLIAKAVSKAIQVAFVRLGFTRLLKRAGLADMAAKTQVDLGGLLIKVVYYFILLIFLQLALGAFGPNPVKDLIDQIVLFLPRVLVAIVLVLVAAAVGRVVGDLVRGALGGRPVGGVLGKITFGFIVALGVIAALNQMGIALTVTTPILITVLATIGGVVVVGVGGGLIGPMQQRWGKWLTGVEKQFSAPNGTKNGVEPAEPVTPNTGTSGL